MSKRQKKTPLSARLRATRERTAQTPAIVAEPESPALTELLALSPKALKEHVDRIFPRLPTNSATSEHQRRNANIRAWKMQHGLIPRTGGRRAVLSFCRRCGVECPSAREAWTHCPPKK